MPQFVTAAFCYTFVVSKPRLVECPFINHQIPSDTFNTESLWPSRLYFKSQDLTRATDRNSKGLSMALEEAICVQTAGYPLWKLFLSSTFGRCVSLHICVVCVCVCGWVRENEKEWDTFPTSVSSQRGTVGQGFWSALMSSCVAQGQRGGGHKYSAHRWDASHNHWGFHATSVRWWWLFHVKKISALFHCVF